MNRRIAVTRSTGRHPEPRCPCILDYGAHAATIEENAAQVRAPLEPADAVLSFDPSTESRNMFPARPGPARPGEFLGHHPKDEA